jgi:hypothetical protein
MSAIHDVQDATGGVVRHRPYGFEMVSLTSVPVDGTAGYAPGCMLIVPTGSAGSCQYINNGSLTACKFETVLSANTTAGAGGYANGVGITTIPGTSQTTVQGALGEIIGSLQQAGTSTLTIPLGAFRALQADNTVGNTIQNGGLLANDTTPNLSVNANGHYHIGYTTSTVTKIMYTGSLPADANISINMSIDIIVRGGGTTNAFGANIVMSVDGSGNFSNVANLTTANTALQTATASMPTVGNITAGSGSFSIVITPAAHGTDAWLIEGIRLRYSPEYPASLT